MIFFYIYGLLEREKERGETKEKEMARDVRQVVAGLLTGSMLMMLCNMVKRDHFDPLVVVRI